MARMHGSGVQVVGTRGDVQPFLAVARALRRHGHRVRLATHAAYRDFVEQHAVEFFPLGGDPAILSEFVVCNKGILPGGGAKGLLQDIHEQVPSPHHFCYFPGVCGICYPKNSPNKS